LQPPLRRIDGSPSTRWHPSGNGNGCHSIRTTQEASLELETLWGITAAVVPTAAGLGIGLMALTGRQTTAGFCFAFAGLWLGVVGFMWLIHTPTSLPYRVTAGLGIGIAVFVVVPLLIRVAWPPNDANAQGQPIQPIPGSPPVVNQGPGSAFSYGAVPPSALLTLDQRNGHYRIPTPIH
jgi:hypothetical protein